MKQLLTLIAICCAFNVYAQTGIGTTTPATSAALDVSATNKGFLPPRMNWTQIQAIPNPTAGLEVYDIGNKVLRMYDGTKWTTLAPRTGQGLHDAPGNYSNIPSTLGATSSISYTCVAIGADKSIFIGGSFYGTASLGGLSFSVGGTNGQAFVIKLDSNGTGLFVKILTPTVGNSQVTTIASDASGNYYVGGTFSNTVDLDPGAAVASFSTAVGDDVFLAKYSGTGIYQWGEAWGGTGSDAVNKIATDGTTIYACGSYAATANFGNSFTSAGNADGWIGSYVAATGAANWSKSVGGSGTEVVYSICMNNSGGASFCGIFNNSATFGSTSLTSNGSQDGFVDFISSTGVFGTAYKIGGSGVDYALDVADFAGNTYVCGDFTGTVNFNLLGGTNNFTSTAQDGYIVKYNSSMVFQYLQALAGTNTDQTTNIELDASGNLYFDGYSAGPVTTIGGFNFTINGTYDVFMGKFNSAGTAQWVQMAGGAGGDNSKRIAVSADGKLLINICTVQSPYYTFDGVRVASGPIMLISRYEE